MRGLGARVLHAIRFAAANHLCVDLQYQGSVRRIEPYSLRETRTGNIVLHAYRSDTGEHRSYRVDRIEGTTTTSQPFVPRWAIELSPPGSYQPVTRTAKRASSGRLAGASIVSRGPEYVYECSYCMRQFRRKRKTNKLRPHKDPLGYPCASRSVHFVETLY
ncbi:MAG: WYL domain-containing protein [Acidobacteriota bacterium]